MESSRMSVSVENDNQFNHCDFVKQREMSIECHVTGFSGKRESLRLREVTRDVDPHQHGGPARDDALQALRALPTQQAQADGFLR